MTSYDLLIRKKYAQWGITAKREGQDYELHRPLLIGNQPVPNKIGDIKVATNAESMNFERPSKFGTPIYWGILDGRLVQPMDYLIGATGTYFITSMQPNLAIQLVECNTKVNVYRENLTSRTGIKRDLVIKNLPISLLRDNNGSSKLDYPDSLGSGEFKMILPFLNNGIDYFTGYSIVDEFNNRYIIRVTEKTDMGFRLWTQRLKPE